MNRKDFMEKVKEEILKREETARVEIRPVQYNNSQVRDSLVIYREGENISPVIGLDPFLRMADNGKSVEEISGQILAMNRAMRLKKPVDTSFLLDWEKIRTRLVRRVISWERNEKLLENVPHCVQMDLAIVYYYLLDEFETGAASVLIRNEYLPIWKITREELDEAARQGMTDLAPPLFVGMGQMMEEMLHMKLPVDSASEGLYVLSNKQKSYGAVYMLDPGVLAGISRKLGGSFYILPSSIHECLILPYAPQIVPEQLGDLVQEVNRTHVDPQEVLSDSVYLYDDTLESLRCVA